jgi:hypothetical protein
MRVDLQRPEVTRTDLQRRRREPQPYIPRQFNALTRGRFLKACRLHHLARVDGQPTEMQVELAHSAAVLQWAAMQAERDGSLQALREAREHRRLLLRVLADFERSIAQPTPASRPLTLAEHLANRPGRR